MEWLTDLGIGMLSAIQPAVFVAALLGVIIGVIIGVIPGLGPAVAMSLAIPLTFTLSPAIAISLLLGIYKEGPTAAPSRPSSSTHREPRQRRLRSWTDIRWQSREKQARRCTWRSMPRSAGMPSASCCCLP